jgi:hypothetical protein
MIPTDPAWIDPAYASVFNSFLLVGAMVFGASRVDAFARNLARTAKGSETRAEAAAAEITRLAAEISATREHVDHALVEIVVLGHAIRDRLERLDRHALIGAADDLMDDSPPPAPGPLVLPPASPESRA